VPTVPWAQAHSLCAGLGCHSHASITVVLVWKHSVGPGYTAPCVLGHLSRPPALVEQWDPPSPVLPQYIKNASYFSIIQT